MWVDTTKLGSGHVRRATVCIAGSGPAGLTLAQSLARRGIDVLVLEAGGIDWDDKSQELYAGDVVGDSYFDLTEARLRMLGGTSGHWGGICRPMSRADLRISPSNGATGWPISYDDIAPYEAETNEILELPGAFNDRELAEGLYELDFQESTPVLFGDKYRDLIDTDPRLHVAVNSVLTDLSFENGRITAVHVLSDESRPWRVEADYVVLCAGGIENARLLRWINDRNGRGLIANHGLIGRYWMEHLHSQPVHGLLYSEALLERAEAERVFFGIASRLSEETTTGVNFEASHLRNSDTYSMLESILCVAPRLGAQLVGLARRNLVCGVILTAHSEQLPDAENRITLSDHSDRLGIPKPVLNWRRTTADRDLIVDRTRALAEGFSRSDVGRFMMMDWTRHGDPVPDYWRNGAWHHMGGTRMADRPEDGIVDANLRVHGLDNLFIGGSSVFPTGSDVNPTYTIVQLALRLADHLDNRIRA